MSTERIAIPRYRDVSGPAVLPDSRVLAVATLAEAVAQGVRLARSPHSGRAAGLDAAPRLCLAAGRTGAAGRRRLVGTGTCEPGHTCPDGRRGDHGHLSGSHVRRAGAARGGNDA